MAKVYLRPRGQFNRSVARAVPVAAAVTARAELVAARTRGFAAGHGSLPGRISVERGSVDRFVVMEHDSAAAIEFGGVKKDGTVVQGLHIMSRAARF